MALTCCLTSVLRLCCYLFLYISEYRAGTPGIPRNKNIQMEFVIQFVRIADSLNGERKSRSPQITTNVKDLIQNFVSVRKTFYSQFAKLRYLIQNFPWIKLFLHRYLNTWLWKFCSTSFTKTLIVTHVISLFYNKVDICHFISYLIIVQ